MRSKSSEKTAPRFFVFCEDGNIRHDEDFTSRRAASEWAEWGHCCTNRHEIVKVEVAA